MAEPPGSVEQGPVAGDRDEAVAIPGGSGQEYFPYAVPGSYRVYRTGSGVGRAGHQRIGDPEDGYHHTAYLHVPGTGCGGAGVPGDPRVFEQCVEACRGIPDAGTYTQHGTVTGLPAGRQRQGI